MNHSPLPWTLETVKTQIGICHKIGPFPPLRPGDEPSHACIYVDGRYKPEQDPESLANAQFIVKACNCHDELVQGLRVAVDLLSKIPAFGDSIGTRINKPMLGMLHNSLSKLLSRIESNSSQEFVTALRERLSETLPTVETATGDGNLGDRLTAEKCGACILVKDIDQNRGMMFSPMSLDALIEYAITLGWYSKTTNATT